MSTESFTQSQQLVIPITESGWFKRPAGKEGYEVVVLEQVSTGNRYYSTLRPGETMRLGESVFGKFSAFAVDMRYGRSFPIEGQFATRERNRKITLKANVRYRVTDSRQVAVGASDPLGEVREKVIDALNRELARYAHDSVNEAQCADIIRSVGYLSHLGITVDGAEIIVFTPEGRTLGYRTAEEEQEHQIRMQARSTQAELAVSSQRERERMDLDQERIQRFDLRDPNVFMHVRPDMVPAVLQMMQQRQELTLETQRRGVDIMDQAIRAYIAQQQEAGREYINLEDIANAVRGYLAPGPAASLESTPPRIDFGEVQGGVIASTAPPEKRIEFDADTVKESAPRIEFGDTKAG